MEIRKVRKAGNSLVVAIPAELSDGIPEGTYMNIERIDDEITMTPLREVK